VFSVYSLENFKANMVDGLCDVERMEIFCSKEQIHGFEDMVPKMEILISDNKFGEAAVISRYWYVQGQNGPREIKSDGVMLFSETDEGKGSCWMLKKATHKKGRQSGRS
jgi:hypothetical protein